MPRIPDSELEALKSGIDLAALVRSKGVTLKPHGKDLIGHCPFHNDKTPSLVVTPQKGLWHCLGACQMGGSVIDWVMKTEGLSFKHAVTLLQEGKAASFLSGETLLSRATIRRLDSPLSLDVEDDTLLNEVTEFYHDTLLHSQKAKDYLSERGILNEEAIKTFKLGYADRTLGLRLPEKSRKEGEAIRERLQSLGVYRDSGHEHLAGSLVVPILDAKGNTANLYGRKILDNLRPGTAYHLYLPGPHRYLWNPSALEHKELILCESLLDALSFWCHGFKNVTTAYGVEGFTEEMLGALVNAGIKKVYLAFDRDEAGDKGAEKVAARLMAEGLECLRVQFPHGMDANEYIQKVKPPEKALQTLLYGASWIGRGLRKENLQNPSRVTETSESLALKSVSDAKPIEAQLELQPEPISNPKTESNSEPSELATPYETRGEDLHFVFGERAYRVRGLQANAGLEALKINLQTRLKSPQKERFYIDQLDLYNAKARSGYIAQSAAELEEKPETLKRDIGRILLKLEELQDKRLQCVTEQSKPKTPPMSQKERQEALDLLQSPTLTERILADFETLGVVGEEVNKLTAYLACVSRKMEKPLGILVQSTSAAGKSALMEAVLNLMPPEEQVKYSAMTGQSLYYMGESNLKFKILAICEEEGAERASYALKLLQSDGQLSIASTGKDPQTGKMVTQEYKVEGPVMIFVTTTKVDIDEELQNRCLTLSVDESRGQTKAIHEKQRFAETLEGMLKRSEAKRLFTLHQNAQRLLKPLKVVNPFAPRLHFLDSQTRTRRDHMKYLTLIRSIALLHQYQRPLKHHGDLEYIEVIEEDITLANQLCHDVLGRTLDELPPQSRKLLESIEEMVCQEKARRDVGELRFTRREVREFTKWRHSQLALHMQRLEEMEYLIVYRGKRGFEYELLYSGEGKEGERFLMGLREGYVYDGNHPGVKQKNPGCIRGQSGPLPGGFRDSQNALSDKPRATQSTSVTLNLKNTQEGQEFSQSYLNGHHSSFKEIAAKEANAAKASPSVTVSSMAQPVIGLTGEP